MPDTGMLLLSVLAACVGALLFLFPHGLQQLSGLLNRTIAACDESLMRYRHVIGVLAFVASYAFFQMALMLGAMTWD